MTRILHICRHQPSTAEKKHDLIAERKVKYRDPVRIGWATKPDEKWQSDIMYIRIHGRFFYLLVFIDEYSRYIVHHSLLVSMDAGSVSMEAQVAIEILRKDSLALSVPRQTMDLLSYLLNSISYYVKIGLHTAGYIRIHRLRMHWLKGQTGQSGRKQTHA
ncbi:MAG: DDE-type integrase/transposase/recombinase [Candidatus Thermoplasmatota archaeon]|nr:DDE-type integrase/transposase/recombinase [Candidatus Thermoplasmatota archaeon]